MVWLEALLAFALTMLVFSTIVTLIVEAIHRLLQKRQQGLRVLLEQLFERFVWPRFGGYLAAVSGGAITKEKARDEFVDALTGDQSRSDADKGGGIKKYFLPPDLTSLTAMQFAERLAGTEVGKAILGKAGDEIEALVKDLVQKFDRLGAEATEFFRARAQLFAVGISFVLAFAANFDALTVFKTYLKEDDLRQSMVANAEAIQKQYLEAAEKLRQAEAAAPPAPGTVPPVPQKVAEGLQSEIAGRRREIDKLLADLRAKGVPIGWSYFPFCHRPEVAGPAGTREYLDPRCTALLERKNQAPTDSARLQCAVRVLPAATRSGSSKLAAAMAACLVPASVPDAAEELTSHDIFRYGIAPFLYWLVAVIAAGALVGLGGPFWYDAVRSLSFVLQLLKPLAQGPKPAGPGAGEEAKTPAEREAAKEKQPTTPVAAFKTAGESQKAAPPAPIGRAPLDARGEPMRI